MIDFTKYKRDFTRAYQGANGKKICIIYDNEPYMLKFPGLAKHNKMMSYANSAISEYLACKIIKGIGLEVQEVLLGTYQNKKVVACKDFLSKNEVILDFASIKNTVIDSETNGYSTELEDILLSIKEQEFFDSEKLEKFFFDMFIVDSLIGNFDRHNGNWGFIANRETSEIRLAPIYDCGSSLYPQNLDEDMEKMLSNEEDLLYRVYSRPESAIKMDGVKINYYEFLTTTENTECIKSLFDVSSRIDMNRINSIIDNTESISDIHKAFLKTMLSLRKELIIDKACELQKYRLLNKDMRLSQIKDLSREDEIEPEM